DQLLALVEGIGDVAIVNSYYIGKVMSSDESQHQAAKASIGVVFPTIGAHGVHENVSGGGVASFDPDRDAAIQLLEFLSGKEAQKQFAEGNHEYPVMPGIAWSSTLANFGTFMPDTLAMSALGKHNTEAIRVFDAA